MSRRRIAGALALGSFVAVLFASCGEDAAEGPDDHDSARPLACDRVIPGAVIAGLGWDDSVAAREDLGGCAWQGEQGVVVVASEAGSYDAACAAVAREGPATGYDPTFDLPGTDAPACAYLREGDVGMSKLAVESDDGKVVTIRVGAVAATPPDTVRSALVALTGHVSEVP